MPSDSSVKNAVALALLRRGAPGAARDLRLRNHLSENDVAEAVGVCRATISNWERGLHTPRGEAAHRYASLLAALMETER